jgi:hypothetical protein
MTLTDLDPSEKLALAGLLRLAVKLGHDAEEEADRVAHIAAQLGPDQLRALVDRAAEVIDDDETAFKAHMRAVTRPEAQELIYGTVYESAILGSLEPAERELLDWVAELWRLPVRDVDAPGSSDDVA